MSKVRSVRASAIWRSLIALVAALALVATTATPVGAQNGQTDEERLEAEEQALLGVITNAQQAMEEFEVERTQVLVDIEASTAAIEGSTDALEQLALARREPASIRVNVALERFVSGEPAQEALIRGLAAAENDPTPFQRQEIYEAILEEADSDIAEIDAQTQSLQADLPDLIGLRQTAAERLLTIDAVVRGLQIDLDESQQQLVVVSEALEWYRDAANRSVLTGRPNANGNARPALVVKIDNVPRARPQTGINGADIVYVELVEGGVTRYAAVFHSEEVGTVGPVRSMRTTDINLLRPLNQPLFANSGANQITTAAVNASPLVNIGAATGAGGAYFRNSGRPAPHNLFSSTGALRNAGGSAGGAPPELFNIRRPGTDLPNASEAAGGVRVSYPNTNVRYEWDGSGWARTQDNAATVDTNGARTSPETVIVQFTTYGVSPADANSPEAQVVGSGAAWIFTEGRLIRGTWDKPTPNAVTQYFDSNGNPVELLPGRIWVELPQPGGASLR